MTKMNRLIVFLLPILLVSCSKFDRKGTLPWLNISDAQYVFQTLSSTKAMSSEEEGYWKITINGILEALTLHDEKGHTMQGKILSVGEVGDSFLYARIDSPLFLGSYPGNNGSTVLEYCSNFLVNKETGEMFAFPKDCYSLGTTYALDKFNSKLWSIEYDNKLYLMGNNFGSNAGTDFFTELDIQTKTVRRCTPQGLNARNLVVGKNGTVAFLADGYSYVMTPDRKLKKYGKSTCSSKIISDSEHNLYLILLDGGPSGDDDIKPWEDISISRILIDGNDIEEEYICNFPKADYCWNRCTYDSFYSTINSKNNNVILFFLEEIFEFDGESVEYVSNSGYSVNDLDNYGFDGKYYYGYVHNYYFKFPVNNISVIDNYDNKVVLTHLDLDTYKTTVKTLEMYPESEYHLTGEIENNGVNLTYSCIRYSDSHTVTFIMDFDGHYEIIHDSNSSFAACNLLMLN